MLKRILVPLDPSPFSASAVQYACELASAHGGQVTGLAIIDAPEIQESVLPVSPGWAHLAEKAKARMKADAHQKLAELMEAFERVCEQMGVEYRAIETIGDPRTIIVATAAYYDLLVAGLRTFYHFQTSDEPGDTLNELMGELSTPILAVPETYRPFGHTLESVIAFDASPAAVRSMRQFAQGFAGKQLDIVIVTSSADLEGGQQVSAPAREYLHAYGFDAVKEEWTPDEIIDVIDREYINQAEVIVAGMHSRRGLFEFHVGSLTDHLVAQATVPVYIGQ